MDDLFNIIGRLYADIYNIQKVIEDLREQIKQKDKQILELSKTDDRSGN